MIYCFITGTINLRCIYFRVWYNL